MPVSTSKKGRESPRTVSHETVIRRGGAQAPTVKFNVDDTGNVIAASIRIASRDGDFGPTSHATRTVTVPLRPQAPRTVAFATGASHPAPDAGVPNFDVDFAWMRAFSARASRLASPAATPTSISLDIITAPVVKPHERPVWAHECPTCRDEWSIRATTETPVLSGICTGHPAATCPECTENHATRVTRATVMLAKAENALATARTPKQYARAEKRVAHWKSALSALGHTPQGMCPRHGARPTSEARAVLSRGTPREHKRTGDNASTLYATLYAAPPSWSRDALGEAIAAGTTIAPDPSKIRRADIETATLVAAGDAHASRPVTTHDAYTLRGLGVVARDETFEGRVIAERWRGRARALDRVCAVCRRAECPSVRRTGQPCGAVAVQPPPPPVGSAGAVAVQPPPPPAESVKRPQGVYVAPTAVSSHGKHGSTYRAVDPVAGCSPAHGPGGYEATPARRDPHGDFADGPSKPRVPRVRVESIAAQAEGIRAARGTLPPNAPTYSAPPRGRIVR